MTWQEGIVGVQLDIARETRSPLHVLAGPGTGKTLAMMRRIARLLEEGADPKRILAVSFTRTAARDLREQLLQLGARGAETVAATTLHSLCFSALLADAVFDATQRRARPLMAFEINQLANDLKDRFGGKREVPKLIDAYDAAWARLQHETAGAPTAAADLAFEGALLDWLRYHRAMLIGELVPTTNAPAQRLTLAPAFWRAGVWRSCSRFLGALNDSGVGNHCATSHRCTYYQACADKHNIFDNVLAVQRWRVGNAGENFLWEKENRGHRAEHL
jgi:hypothetical protein